MKRIKVSVIIVHYKARRELFDCISALQKTRTTIPYEIIIVDNSKDKILRGNLRGKYPSIKYFDAKENLGFGAGNNLGANYASGKFLFFLNPDTEVSPNTLDILVSILKKRENVGIIAPLFTNKKSELYPLQGSMRLGIKEGIFALSFFNKLFPKNPISKNYWLANWDKKTMKKVDVVPGTAFMIRRKLFEELKGFDEKFFLFFEEHDLCKRVEDKGYKIYITPFTRIRHIWGASTKKSTYNLKSIYFRSQFYYFRKHFGLVPALFVQVITTLNKNSILILATLFLAVILRFYKLVELMPLIPDQGWFYLSARDMLVTGEIPLVGITSSHTWLHQGPLWTYMLALMFAISNFHPASGALLTALLGVITVYLVYLVGKELFSDRVGMITSILYAASPLAIAYSRMPYHTSPIPLFSALFILCLAKWVKGNVRMFPVLILLLGILYNLELATVLFVFILILFLIYGIIKKTAWANVFTKRILVYSLLGFFLSMLPILIYDFQNGFPQTIKFAAWMGYQMIKLFGINLKESPAPESFQEVFSFFLFQYRRLVFLPSYLVSLILLGLSFAGGIAIYIQRIKQRKETLNYAVLFLSLFILLAGFFFARTRSEAYLHMIFPFLILILALNLERFYTKNFLKPIIIGFLLLTVAGNTFYLINKSYFIDPSKNLEGYAYGPGLSIMQNEVDKIIMDANGRPFSLKAGRIIESMPTGRIDNYEYLAWWKKGNIASPSELTYTIYPATFKAGDNVIYRDKYVLITKDER